MKLAGFSMQGKPKTEKKYYLIYARKSTESEDKQVNSIEDQLSVAEELKTKLNLNVLETFSESKSAKMPGRVEFNRMLSLAYQRQDIKGIVCWKLNRLSRNPQDEGAIRWLLQSGMVEEIVTPQKTYRAEDSDFVMANEGAQAQRFITDLREDTARGVDKKLVKGVAPILAPIGYRNCIEKRQGKRDIEPHHLYFSLWRKVVDKALTGNYSVQQLYLLAQELDIKTSRGKNVSRTHIYDSLRSPFYCGKFIYRGKLYQGVHKPLMTEEEFDLLQEILDKRSKPKTQRHFDLLTGFIECGECRMLITAEKHIRKYKNGKNQEFAYYRCTKKSKGIKCSQPFIPVQELDEQVLSFLESIQLSPKFVAWSIKWLNVLHENQKGLRKTRYEALRQSYDEVVGKLEKLLDLKLKELLTDEEFGIKKEELMNEKATLNAGLEKVDIYVGEWTKLVSDTFDFVKTINERYANGSIETKKSILQVIGSNLVLKDKKLIIEARTPFAYVQKLADTLQVRAKEEWVEDRTMFEPLLSYYSRLQPQELAFYKTAFATL